MIDTKETISNLEIAKQAGYIVAEGPIRSLCGEIERLAKICEQLQFGGRPDCPKCFTASTNYDPATRDWFCGPCDNGRTE